MTDPNKWWPTGAVESSPSLPAKVRQLMRRSGSDEAAIDATQLETWPRVALLEHARVLEVLCD
jgi:hypothetical protein